MKLAVKVTVEDIASGLQVDCRHCPVARAVTREAGAAYAIVKHSSISVFDVGDKKIGWCPTPPEAQDFIEAFDGSEPVAPFSFEVVLR